MTSFVDSGAHGFVLPLMQGFVGQKGFEVAVPTEADGHIDEKETKDSAKRGFLLTLISRRSIKRPGLRYLRRGVDDAGNTANTVETEQILSSPNWDPAQKVYSFLQVRGSIPLYFSQSPYAFKPVPMFYGSTEMNQLAFDRHFQGLARRYGKVQAVSLIDKQGGELKMGQEYEKYVQKLNASGGGGMRLGLEWFDFHSECLGMKFENVRRLVNMLRGTLEEYGDTVIQNNNTLLQRQSGIVRINCMDCLDRTGVTQCAFGQWALEQELKRELGIEDFDLQNSDSSTQWFNGLWADSGDAISKQYSSTAALKGDYTRTRKRNYRGALNDLGLTLSRYYNNMVNDYFSQTCIDYLLGNVSTDVFREFETEMQSVDPGISVGRLRQNAIDTSCRIIVGGDQSDEEFLGGWTMLTPAQPNTLRSLPFEESVLLLTDAAVYSCRFDWNTNKVISFERVDLHFVDRILYGTYVTSILTGGQMNEKANVGLVVVHGDGDANSVRVNTRSLQNNVDLKTHDSSNKTNDGWDIYSDIYSWFKGSSDQTNKQPTRQEPAGHFLSFKALPLSNSATGKNRGDSLRNMMSPLDFVRSICEEIERAATMTAVDSPPTLERRDICSLDEAKRTTGYLECLFYDIKKLVWAS